MVVVGELQISKTAKVFRNMLKQIGLNNNNFRSYEDVIEKQIPTYIANTRFRDRNGNEVGFSNVKIIREHPEKPPSYFRKYKENYMLTFYATARVGSVEKEVSLFNIPCMLGSKFCYLYGKNKQEVFEAGECPYDPFAYFIMKGEKVINLQDQLRNSLTITSTERGETRSNITCPCRNGTIVMELMQNPSQVLEVKLSFYGSNTIPLLLLFYVFGYDVDEAVDMIMKFIPKEYYIPTIQVILPSVILIKNTITMIKAEILSSVKDSDFKRKMIDDPEQFERDLKKLISKKILDDFATKATMTTLHSLEDYNKSIMESIFPQIETIPDKFNHLALMVSQHIRRLIGIRPEDNRDAWGNKRVMTPGRWLEKQFLMAWDHQVNMWTNSTSDLTPNTLGRCDNVSNSFSGNMNPNRWGYSKIKTKENIIEMLHRDTEVAIYNQISRINTAINRNLKLSSVRMVDGNQVGVVCPFESPEGDSIGLIKNLTCSVLISIAQDQTNIKRILEDFNLEPEGNHLVLLNGIIQGYCDDGPSLARELRRLRRQAKFASEICVFWSEKDMQVQIYTDPERLCHGVFTVEDGELNIFNEEKRDPNIWDKPISYLVERGLLEFIDVREQEYVVLCESVELFYNKPLEQRLKYDYCVVDPQTQFSIMSSTACKANMEQCPRISYQAGMSKQALGSYSINRNTRFDGSAFKVLRMPTRPSFEVESAECIGLNNLPTGQSLVVAYMARPFNQEDGIELNIDTMREKLQYYKYITISAYISSVPTKDDYEILKIPDHNKYKDNLYQAIDPIQKLPRIGAYIREKDCIIPKVRCNPTERDSSIYAGIGENGYVDAINVRKGAGFIDIKIRLCKLRYYTLGAKMSARYAQKGVITKHSDIHNPKDFPIVIGGPNHGLIPDIIINPHSIPSRMTVGQLIEGIASKYSAQTGEFIDASSFKPLLNGLETNYNKTVQEHIRNQIQEMGQKLEGRGLNYKGLERVGYIREDGQIDVVENPIFIMIMYYQCLRHHAEDKIQHRGENGKINPLTHQAASGRSKQGGLRFGEMERDAMISHGSDILCLENLCYASDKYQMILCKHCGIIPTNTADYSYRCKRCGNNEFRRTTIPYPMKLLTQILSAIGVLLRFKLQDVDT